PDFSELRRKAAGPMRGHEPARAREEKAAPPRGRKFGAAEKRIGAPAQAPGRFRASDHDLVVLDQVQQVGTHAHQGDQVGGADLLADAVADKVRLRFQEARLFVGWC
ncbi:hypothetical protein QO209_31170, partial [Pseudomonas citronellolis]|uniref:hypothetical protein n=1 Tax=Pseudomonas citronellolis TaxID=53408 RepID=UPI0026495A58